MRALIAIAAGATAGCGRIAFDPPAAEAGDARVDGVTAARCGDEASLVACYSFETGTDDSSGRGNHGTGPLSLEPGHIGQAGTFGPAVSMLVADTTSLEVSHVTVMAWVRLDTLPVDDRSVIIDHNAGFALFVLDTGHLGFAVSAVTTGGANDTAPVSLGTWTHVASSYDGATTSVYRDGVLVATSTNAMGNITTIDTSGTRIGGNLSDSTTTKNEPFVGAIDELGVWNEALPAARIATAAAL